MGRFPRRGAGPVVALAIVAGSCSIGVDSAPRDVPVEERGNFGGVAAGGPAAGASRIYLITQSEAEQQLLRSVPRGVPATPEDVLLSLLAGRNEFEQLETAIPADLILLGTPRLRGQVLTVDVNDAFGELDVNGLRLAVAQIVATATSIENVKRVILRINGEEQAWPTDTGVLTEEALSIYDYPSLIESTQPPFPAIPSGG